MLGAKCKGGLGEEGPLCSQAWDTYVNFCGCFKEKVDEQLSADVKGTQARSLVTRVTGVLLHNFQKEGVQPGILRTRVQAEIRTLRAAGLQEKTALHPLLLQKGFASTCYEGVSWHGTLIRLP